MVLESEGCFNDDNQRRSLKTQLKGFGGLRGIE